MGFLPDDPPPVESLFGQYRPALRTETLEDLDKIVENSSEKNRNFFIAYLGLLIYVQAIVFSTTDLQLLVSAEGLKLPIVDLNVPLVGFYVVVPIFVIALHFNFLQNLESHHYKLMRWQDAHPGGKVPRSRIQPFLFDYANLERGSQLERWVRGASSLLCLNFGPITLGLLLWRYTDRQEAWATVWHYVAFMFDIYLVWRLRVALRKNRNSVAGDISANGWRHWVGISLRLSFGLFVSAEALLTYFIATLDSEPFLAHVLPTLQKIDSLAQRDASLMSRVVSLLLPRIAIDPSETVWRPDDKALELEAKMAGKADWVKHFNEHGKGYIPATKSLRLAHLSQQRLPKAQMDFVKMEGADLSGTVFRGASFVWSHLQNTKLPSANLENSEFYQSNFQGAGLSNAKMQNSRWAFSNFSKANMSGIDLQGEEIVYASFAGTNLQNTNLVGADFTYCSLAGANLGNANLSGASLGPVWLQGTDFSRAKLQGTGILTYNKGLDGALFHRTVLFGTEINEFDAPLDRPGTYLARSPKFKVLKLDHSPFEEPKNWKATYKALNKAIPKDRRMSFIERIKQAQAKQPSPSEIALIHDPSAIYSLVIPRLCQSQYNGTPPLAIIQGIRQIYNPAYRPDELKERSEFINILPTINRTLCTLPACADLKDDIEGLDCAPFAEKKIQKP